MPDVSVVIPTANRAEFLRTAIASVLAQTFQDFEIIVVDDASKDHTAEVVGNCGDSRIRYFRHETSRGGSAARNTGIRNSKAESIAFLDDDDEWHPEKLDRQVMVLKSAPPQVGVINTGYNIVDRSSGRITGRKIPTQSGNLSRALLVRNCVGGTSAVLIKRECLNRVGGFDEELRSYQDYDLWIRLSQYCEFECISEPLLNYYVHSRKIWTNLEALDQGLQVMERKHCSSSSLRKYLSYHHLALGRGYWRFGNRQRARQCFLKAIRMHPLELRHYARIGIALFGLGCPSRLAES